MNLYLGVDPSLRSTGIVAIDDNDNIVFTKLIIVPAVHKDEDNITIMGDEIARQVGDLLENHNIITFGYERLAFNAPSGVRDKISGSYWYNRICLKELTYLYESFPYPPNIISPPQWRKNVVTKEDRKLAKEKGEKVDLKETALSKMPDNQREILLDAIKEHGLKRAHVYDLCDAYWIAIYAKYNQ